MSQESRIDESKPIINLDQLIQILGEDELANIGGGSFRPKGKEE